MALAFAAKVADLFAAQEGPVADHSGLLQLAISTDATPRNARMGSMSRVSSDSRKLIALDHFHISGEETRPRTTLHKDNEPSLEVRNSISEKLHPWRNPSIERQDSPWIAACEFPLARRNLQ